MALALFGWSEADFWSATPFGFGAALVEYERVFAAGSQRQKRRDFARFKEQVEAGMASRANARPRRGAP